MLITPKDLAAQLDKVRVLDASWHMPDTGRDATSEFEAGHIPGALRFDIDVIADRQSELPHTLPSAEQFAASVGEMGIDNDTPVVVYEVGAPFSAPRVWWMFRVMGHDAVSVLDGGLAAWRAEGFDLETGLTTRPAPRTFTARPRPERVADADKVAATLDAGCAVVDVRSAERFEGRVPEPREGLRAGHMPGATNLHYQSLIGPDGRLLPDDRLAETLADNGVATDQPVVTTCGSGVTAAILALAVEKLGGTAAVYDGSWTEWGADPARPVATGRAQAAKA